MKLFLKILSSLLLLINGIGAFYGGLSLIRFPDGSGLKIPLSYLQYSPFDNYLIPGLVLLLVNGVFDFLVLLLLFLNYKHHAKLIMLQGALLTGWICIQILMVRDVMALHIMMGTTGSLLIACGWALRAKSRLDQVK